MRAHQPIIAHDSEDRARAEFIAALLSRYDTKRESLNGAGATRIDMRTGEAQEDAE